MVHIEDRGYQFSDGVYEVCEIRDGRIVDERRHLGRLERSLGELRIGMPMPAAALAVVIRECVRRNCKARAGWHAATTASPRRRPSRASW
jgi:D-alanine transaminase